MGWACGAYGWGEGVCRFLLLKPKGRIGLAQDRERWRTLVSVVMNLPVPWNVGNSLTSFKTVSFSRRNLHRGVSKYIYNYDSNWMCLTGFLSRRCVDIYRFWKSIFSEHVRRLLSDRMYVSYKVFFCFDTSVASILYVYI